MSMLDIVIVGAGPAGLSAAIQARKRALSVTIIAREGAPGALTRAPHIDNYPGMPGISGPDLLAQMRAHAKELGADFHDGQVQSILPMEGSFGISAGSDFFTTRAVILATGAKQPKLLEGEEALLGAGVSYCATCDGMLYRGKRVAVLGASEHAVSEANFLATLAGETLYFGKPDAGLHPDITVIDAPLTRLSGEGGVLRAVHTRDADYPVDGLFILRDQMALGTLLGGLALQGAFIRVDRMMRTNLARVYAAGDCTGQPLQVGKAVGEGVTAATSAAEDLAK